MQSNVNPAELFARLTQLPRAHQFVEFPKADPETGERFQFPMWVLTHQEMMIADAQAHRDAKRLLKDEGIEGSDILANYKTINVLFSACRHPSDIRKPLFTSPEQISALLSTDEIGVLANHYAAVAYEMGPLVGSMTAEEIEQYINTLKEGGVSANNFLGRLSWEGVKDLLIALASQLPKSPTDNGSLGSPQQESSPILKSKPSQTHNRKTKESA